MLNQLGIRARLADLRRYFDEFVIVQMMLH